MANRYKFPWAPNRKSMHPLQWNVDYSIESLTYRIIAFKRTDENGDFIVYDAVPHKFNGRGRRIEKPTFEFTNLEELQPLMNALWELGVRPNAYTITNEHFNSVKEHLGDMKTLVEKAYKLEFPKEKK